MNNRIINLPVSPTRASGARGLDAHPRGTSIQSPGVRVPAPARIFRFPTAAEIADALDAGIIVPHAKAWLPELPSTANLEQVPGEPF